MSVEASDRPTVLLGFNLKAYGFSTNGLDILVNNKKNHKHKIKRHCQYIYMHNFLNNVLFFLVRLNIQLNVRTGSGWNTAKNAPAPGGFSKSEHGVWCSCAKLERSLRVCANLNIRLFQQTKVGIYVMPWLTERNRKTERKWSLKDYSLLVCHKPGFVC